ncbi:MAG: minor capsid protein [Fimbriimonadia bacterium]|nr:minor capsid protein [Fimbriimonadia bacterium]
MTIFDTSDRFRRSLLQGEEQAREEMTRAYGIAWSGIREELDRLTEQIQAALDSGLTVDTSYLLQRQRLQRLERVVIAQLQPWAAVATDTLTGQQRAMLRLGVRHAVGLLHVSEPSISLSFAQINAGALREMVGFAADGSPLRELLQSTTRFAADRVVDSLIRSVAVGLSPRQTAERIRDSLAAPLSRAQTLARTEMLRAYREATRQTYLANSDVVEGWVWHASLDARTCVACLAQHGSAHALDEPMQSHPNCRCAMLPQTPSWSSLGLAGLQEREPVATGEAWLRLQSAATQRRALGPRWDAWRRGELRLYEMTREVADRRWGTYRVERSLTELRLR